MPKLEVEKLYEQWELEDETAVNTAITALLEHRQGRKFFWWLLQLGRVGLQPFANNALNTSFNCGELNVGNKILSRLMEVAPDRYVEMIKENADEQRTRDTAYGNATDLDRNRDTGSLFGEQRSAKRDED